MLKSTTLSLPALDACLDHIASVEGHDAAIGVITSSPAAAGGLARRSMPAGAHDYQTKESGLV